MLGQVLCARNVARCHSCSKRGISKPSRGVLGEQRTYAAKATNVASTVQLGDAPATIAKTDEEKSETLKAKRRPITSAPGKRI